MLVKACLLGPLKWWVHQDITSLISDNMVNINAIRYGLDAVMNHFDQILKNQCRQIDLVARLDLVHEPVVNLANGSML